MNGDPCLNAAAQLSECDREPIHAPGHIQPHGVLIATVPGDRRISHVSQNFEASLGLPATASLNAGLDQLIGPVALAAIEQRLDGTSEPPAMVLKLPIPLRPYRHVLAHRWQGRTIVELEDAPQPAQEGSALSRAQAVIGSLLRARTVAELCDRAARDLRLLSGYDRVMVYRFDDAGHGTVVAEDKRADLPAYLDLRYPASDIPQQARRLYVLQRVRGIPERDYRPVPLLSADGATLDMSLCTLRGISPLHLEYMANMGVRASLAISLLQDGAPRDAPGDAPADGFWGMIVCHHMTPRAAAPDLRALCDVVGQVMSVLLQRVAHTQALTARLARHRMIAALREDIDTARDVAAGLSRRPAALLQLMGADGALIRCGGETTLLGTTPPPAAAAALVDTLLGTHGAAITAIHDAGIADGAAGPFADVASGVLLLPLTDHPGDAVAWFRPELPQTVRWGGDPRKPVAQSPDGGRLSPRKSFAAWTELLRGRSKPWTPTDLQAAEELRRTITAALLQQAETQLVRLSAYDPLTELPNRRTIEARLQQWQVDGEPAIAALLFIDLDRFKAINDTLGHAAGDECLVQVAARLRRLAPPGSLAGRFGGDEFVLFWPGAAAAEAQALAEALVADFARPFLLQGRGYYSGASIGVVCASIAGLDAMMRQADAAMYAAKRQGGGRAVMFQPQLHAAAVANMQTEQDLFHAIENNALEVHYQPIVNVSDRRVFAFEALARWRHPVRGWVSPAEFIPRAEAAGLIARLGSWVLEESVRRVGRWRQMQPGLKIAVNVSALQLTDSSLAKRLPGLLAAGGVGPSAIKLEVTESALMDAAAVRELGSLRALGVRIALDDFGTGHSSLSYLQSLPITTVKIDRSFVTPLGKSAKADRFFTAIVDLARTIDLRTIAEGCETWEQWRVIQAAGCEAVQGWLVAPAMDAAAAERFLSGPAGWSGAPATAAPAIGGNGLGSRAAPVVPLGGVIQQDGLEGRDVFFAAVKMSPVPMSLADPHQPDMPLVFVNDAFEHLTGYERSQIIGQNCRILQGAESDPAAIGQIRAALAARQPVAVEVINYRKDGSSFWNVVHISPVFDAAGRLVYFFGSQLDVTRRKWT
jgi:diguanylate cyclase (GGDEF)-like protein/PAS domain S-box-containing protein